MQRRGGGFTWRGHSFRICFDAATILLQFGFEMATIFAMIRPRSWSSSFVDRRPIDWRRFHHVSSPIAARSRRDRSSIGPRSWSSSMKPLNLRIAIFSLMEIGWSWCRHDAKEIGFSTAVRSRSCGVRADDDPTLLVSLRGNW